MGRWDPTTYAAEIQDGLPGYAALQDAVVAATRGEVPVRDALELGTGTGETARRVLDAHPGASLHALDTSEAMLGAARAALAGRAATFTLGALEEPLPGGPFDLVVSALAVHHLGPAAKADLFLRVSAALVPGGRFVLGDVVVPEDPGDARVELEAGYDQPDSVADQLAWLEAAGLNARLAWSDADLAVIVALRA